MKIGFIIRDKTIAAWEYEMLKRVKKELPGSTFVFAVYNTKKEKPDSKEPFLLSLYKKFEDRWFRSLPDAFQQIPLQNILDEFQAKFIDFTERNDRNIDLVYTSSEIANEPMDISFAKNGLWTIRFTSGYWEVMENEPVIKSSLIVKLPGSDHWITVYKGITSTVPFSIRNTLITLAWKSASFLAFRLKELSVTQPANFFKRYTNKFNQLIHPVEKGKPDNFKVFLLSIKNLIRYFSYKIRNSLVQKKFSIFYATDDQQPLQPDINTFKSLSPPPGNFWADPFVVKQNETFYIFFEEFLYKENKGHISVINLVPGGSPGSPKTVLELPHHLSYPFVFKWQDEFYMIPETSSKKTVTLYKAKDFPYQWEFVMNLLEDVILIDATLIFHNDKWWMFGCTQTHPVTSTNDQLMLYYSDDLFSDKWTAHPQNPVVTDISNCRPAGKIFKHNDCLYRPAQNNASHQYGYGIKLNKIIMLNENEYQEVMISEINPRNNLAAIHTFNFEDELTVIDGVIK